MRFPQAGARTIGGGMARFLQGLLPGTRRDWAGKVGDRWRSSAVAIALNWVLNSFPEAKPCIKRENAKGETELVIGHPLVRRLRRPNKLYGPRVLWAGTLISFLTDGNAYWLKVRDRVGRVAELWYLPHFFVDPQGPEDGSTLIDRYAYTVNGVTTYYPKGDIVHFRNGINPRDQRRGWCPLAEQDREIASDNERATYQAALLEQCGVPGLIISADSDEVEFDPGEDGERIKKRIAATTTGDARFEPVIIPAPIKVTMLGFSPEQMALDKLANAPLIRVFGALGLDPMVAGQPSDSKTYSNYGEADAGGWKNCILPTMAMLSEGIDMHLLPEYEGEETDLFFGFDTRQVKALQEDLDKLYARLEQACGGPFLTPNEARREVGRDDLPDQDALREKAPPPPTLGAGGAEDAPGGKKPSPKMLTAFKTHYAALAQARRARIEAGRDA